MNITNYLNLNGWNILREDNGMVFAQRKNTGKQSFFIEGDGLHISEVEISRVWTKKGFHPFIYYKKKNKLLFYDFLFDEFVKNP